jgi:exopolyphosphatase / guanosine-5'-triphosphate,3'-diphosphate pyrophosphatase
MEIVLGRDAEPEFAMSLPLGAGRLARVFLPDDPPGREQLAALRRYVNATLREVADRLPARPPSGVSRIALVSAPADPG